MREQRVVVRRANATGSAESVIVSDRSACGGAAGTVTQDENSDVSLPAADRGRGHNLAGRRGKQRYRRNTSRVGRNRRVAKEGLALAVLRGVASGVAVEVNQE